MEVQNKKLTYLMVLSLQTIEMKEILPDVGIQQLYD